MILHLAILLALALGGGRAAGPGSVHPACPPPAAQDEARVRRLLSLPGIAESGADLGTAAAADVHPLAHERDLATCRALWSAVEAQERRIAPGDRVSFYRSGNRFFVPVTPRRPEERGRIRIGEYSAIEVYDAEFRLVARFSA